MPFEIKEYQQFMQVQEGIYPTKPENYLSLYKVLSGGTVPRDQESIKIFAMPSKPESGYYYVSPDDCVPMNETQQSFWDGVVAAKQAEKEAKKKQKEEEKASKPQSQKKRTSFPKKEYKPLNFDNIVGKNIVCFDTETTGTFNNDEILQLTIASMKNGKPEVLFSSYCKPTSHTEWKGAMIVNHISPRMVKDKPTLQELLGEFKDIFDNADIITGYNVSFDIRMLQQSLPEGFDIPSEKVIDVMEEHKANNPDYGGKLINAVERYCPDKLEWFQKNAHDASADTIATLYVLEAQAKERGYDLFPTNDYEIETDEIEME